VETSTSTFTTRMHPNGFVITYRERYTDGTQRTWKCVVAGSEVSLGK
jgi:hypothetical protein